MNFTIENIEFCLLIVVRIACIIYTAPFFNLNNIPKRVKAGISIFFAILVISITDYEPLVYTGMLGYSLLIMKEAITGILIGYAAGACTYIISFSGQLIDMEIGFSMVTLFDPGTRAQTTATGNLYSYFVMLCMLATNMHYFVIQALYDSFKVIPLGGAKIEGNLYLTMVEFVVNYFVIAFRIIFPIFACTLIINVVLGILAKVAPQMNMFVIGMQLKVLVGIFTLFFVCSLMPSVGDFVYTQMREFTTSVIKAITP